MSLSEALDADRRGDLEVAATLYESELDSVDIRPYVNLAVLYWQATDFGLASFRRLSQGFVDRSYQRYPELLEEGERRFPQSTEARYWKRYIGMTNGQNELQAEECVAWLREAPDVLAPAMTPFVESQGESFVAEATELLDQSRADGTTRSRYIVSVIEGVLTRKTARSR